MNRSVHEPAVNVSSIPSDLPANLSVPVPIPVTVGEARNNTTVQTDPENAAGETNNGTLENVKTAETKNVTLENVKTAENTTHPQRRLLEDTKGKKSEGAADSGVGTQGVTVENNNVLEEEADSSFNLFRDVEDMDDEYSYDYDDYVDDSMWGDEDWRETAHQSLQDYVLVDSHILSTPVSLLHLALVHYSSMPILSLSLS
jgi:hypothetical protein